MDIITHKHGQTVSHKGGSVVIADGWVVGHKRVYAVPYLVNSDVASDYLANLNEVTCKIAFADRPTRSCRKNKIVFLVSVRDRVVCQRTHALRQINTMFVFYQQSPL